VSEKTLAELGEDESLRRTVSRLTGGSFSIIGSGDDAALIAATDSFLVSTDTLVEDHDFKLDWSGGFDLGYKAVASNLSDIAAMGGTPTALVVALVVPKSTKISWLEQFADGLQAAINELAPGCEVVGGDLAAGSQIVIAITVHGSLNNSPAVLRSGAKPNDLVAVAGSLGKAACGLALLESGNQDLIRAYDEWVLYQLRPNPPISSGALAAAAGATAMLDISDGLIKDASRIARASEVTIDIRSTELKGFEAMLDLPAQALAVDPISWVLFGGEDHSLLATFSPDASIPKSFKVIGSVVEAKAGQVLLDGKKIEQQGWDSIRGAS
jgi:thiamine-monophosphate kinase